MTLECRDQKATQQSRTYLGISQGFGWPSEILKEILIFFFWLFSHHLPSCLYSLTIVVGKRLLVILYFLCYLKHKNFLWQNYGHILEQVVVLRALWNLYVATESQRRQGRARVLTPRTPFCFFWNLHCSHGAFGLKVGKKKQLFLTLDSIFIFHLDLDWKKKKNLRWKKKKRKKKKYTKKDNEKLTEKA